MNESGKKPDFPYERFAVWLQDAITVGEIVNQLMDAAKVQEPVHMTFAEYDLLTALRQKDLGQHPILDALAKLSLPAEYPALSIDEIQTIWNLLTVHIVSDEQYAALQESLTIFLNNAHPTGAMLLSNIAGCFGPALAPKESWDSTL